MIHPWLDLLETRQLGMLADLPLLVAWGSKDQTIPPRHDRAIAARLPDSYLVEIDGAGHYPHETAAGQLLAALHRFLSLAPPFHYRETRWRELLTNQTRTAIDGAG